jgi:hypothetical protein
MYINPILVDKYLFSRRVPLPPILFGTFIAASYYYDSNKEANSDLTKVRGRCDKELSDFGKCLEKHNDQFNPCEEFLEAYKRCLQNK